MSVNAFLVKSNRIHDIELREGTTVSELQKHLGRFGYDVKEARVRLRRPDGIVIGRLENHVLVDGENIEFHTFDCDLPALKKLTETGKSGPVCDCTHKHKEESAPKGMYIKFRRIPNGIVITATC